MTKRIPSVLIAALCAVAAATVTIAILVSGGSSRDDAITLDDPGVVQEPTIATNTDVSGEALPRVDLLALDGSTLDTAGLLDGRPLVINLWFSTCQPCKREMPAIQSAHSTYGDRVRFVGVNVQDSVDTATSFARELGIDYEIVRDPDGNLSAAAGVATFPMTFFVAADGTIVSQFAGEMSTDDLESGIDGVLGS